MNYYEILQVSENASDEVIHMAYKALAKKYHPDLYQGDMQFAERKMKEINEAFDVLSNTYKRAQYDDYLKSQRKSNYSYRTNETKQTSTTYTEKSRNEYNFPSSKKSGWIIVVLLLLSFIQFWHPYAESDLYDYSFLLGTIDFCFISIVLMIVPMFIGVIKGLSPKGIKKLCLLNSIIVYGIFLLLFATDILSVMVIGWLNAVFYYFINKHILLQLKSNNCDRKKAIISVAAILLILILLALGCSSAIKHDSKKTLIVAVEDNFNPYSDQKNGEYYGIHVDIAVEIAHRLDCKVEFITSDWDGLFYGIINNQYDVVFGIEYTPERAEYYLFSTPYWDEMCAIFGDEITAKQLSPIINQMIEDGTIRKIFNKYGIQ